MNYVQRRRFLWVLFLTGLAILALTAILTNATTLVRLPFNQLAQESTAIARLRCLASQSAWERGELWTETRFEVIERQKGLLPGLLTVRLLGGSDGNLHSHVDGVPMFRTGEEVYLFLWSRNGEPYLVLGWSQGTFRIARNGITGTETITQESATELVFDPPKREFRQYGIRNVPMPLFQAKLKKALQEKN
jgi:hypothetical protein